jgi:hypothetical protein
MFEVYCWDEVLCRFRVEGVFEHRGAAEVVAGRLAHRTGIPHLIRVKSA